MKTKDIYMYVLGGVIVLAILAIVGLLIFFEVPPGNRDLLNIVLGALLSQFANIVGYFYGSSKGSSDKTEIMANGKEHLGAPQPPSPQ